MSGPGDVVPMFQSRTRVQSISPLVSKLDPASVKCAGLSRPSWCSVTTWQLLIGGENCLDFIDHVPVNTGVLAGQMRPFEVVKEFCL